MKNKRFFTSAIAVTVILLTASIALAVPGANFVYNETDLGGTWQYDYTFFNTSTEGEFLYEVFLFLPQEMDVTGLSLPTGWDGNPWAGENATSFLNAFSTEIPYDIAAGSSLGGFSFITGSQIGNISYEANLSGDNVISGTTVVVPEPVSVILFVAGGAVLAAGKFVRRKRTA
ncbi:MAG: PEP-CTERM sorting domain-containing protein [Nitrospiraceae bacterium]|nr:MAG: PEP-CTERM sorting domain-containing protein [Nitrospiraceae bacterium]